MKKINVLMLSVFFVALSINLNAQTRSRLSKVGVIDANAVYNTVLEDKTLLSKIEAKFNTDNKAFETLEADIKKLNSDIAALKKSSDGSDASQKEISDLEKQLATLEEKHKKEAPLASMRKSKKNQAIKEEINKYIGSSILGIVRREGYTAIIEKSYVFYVDRDFDLTTQVIAHVRSAINAIK